MPGTTKKYIDTHVAKLEPLTETHLELRAFSKKIKNDPRAKI